MSAESWELLHQARYLPEGPDRIAALERAIAEADASNDLDAGFAARRTHLAACEFGGAADRAIASFAWCLAQHDCEPERFGQLLWEYKWVTVSLPRIASVPRDQVLAPIDDMERRYREAGGSMIPVAKVRWRVAWTMGDLDVANEWHETWRRLQRETTASLSRPYLSDCPACDAAEESSFLTAQRRDREAVDLAGPILEGRMWCKVVPHFTLGQILPSLVRLGRDEQASACHLRGYPMTAANPEFLAVNALHLGYTAHVGDTAKSIQLIERHLPWAIVTRDDEARGAFLLAARDALDVHLAKPRVRDRRQLRLPAGVAADGHSDGTVSLGALRDWLDVEHERVSGALDARSGNTYYTSMRTVNEFIS